MAPLFTRESLKHFFKKGKFPSEVHFSHLIDSSVNKLDDGFAKSEEDGLQLAPQGKSDRLISFFKHINDTHPEWQINFREIDNRNGLSIESVSTDAEGKQISHSWVFIDKEGRIGLNNTEPQHLLDVNGTVGMHTRVGSFLAGSVPGDGKWYPILSGLRGLQAFEVVARIGGLKNRGKYALTHAIALSTYGRSKSKIKQVRAHYGWFWNRISLRWKAKWQKEEGGEGEWVYSLQVRTRSHYGNLPLTGEVVPIRFHITRLWNDEMDFPKLSVEEPDEGQAEDPEAAKKTK